MKKSVLIKILPIYMWVCFFYADHRYIYHIEGFTSEKKCETYGIDKTTRANKNVPKWQIQLTYKCEAIEL